MSTEINLDDYHVREISQEIREKELDYLGREKWLAEMRSHRDAIELDITAFVTNEKVEGKPRYSNDLSRKAEIADRLKAHKAYQESSAKIDEAEFTQKSLRIEIDFLLRNFRVGLLAYEAIAIGRRS
jgi:hypothetical protein